MITGKDRGKSGAVLAAFPKKDRVLVVGVGMIKKHQKSNRRGQAGQIIDRPTPVHISNVAIKDTKTQKPARVGYRTVENKKVRIAKQSGEKL